MAEAISAAAAATARIVETAWTPPRSAWSITVQARKTVPSAAATGVARTAIARARVSISPLVFSERKIAP